MLTQTRRTSQVAPVTPPTDSTPSCYRRMHTSHTLNGKVVPFVLSDIGEGIAEVEVMQVFVEEGDSVEEFDNVMEVQSDKVS